MLTALRRPGCLHRHVPRADPAQAGFLLRQHVRKQWRTGNQRLWRLCGTAQQQHRQQRSFVIAASASWRPDFSLDPPVTREQLQDPAYIHGSASTSSPVQDRRGEIGLDAYMRLPVEHYYELDPGLIKPLGGSAFALQVPRVSLLNVWVEPLVHVNVRLVEGTTAADSAVVIEATNWSLRGSELIESLGLNRRFSLAFQARLNWTPADAAKGALPSNGNGSAAVLPPAQGQVQGHLDLEVWSEVIGPFRFMPRAFLGSTGSAVLGALVRGLLPPFIGRLVADYEKWAASPEYRRRRTQQGSDAGISSV